MRRARFAPPSQDQDRLVRGEIVIDLQRHTLTVAGSPIELTPTEFNLLVFLMNNTNKVLTHQDILQAVWGPEYGREAEYLRVYIGRLRQKIETNPSAPTHLLTERGIGYTFQA
jgi:two-component system KDP operon response regulator KdpE